MNGTLEVIVRYTTTDGRQIEESHAIAREDLVSSHFPRHLVGAAAREAFDQLGRTAECGA